MKMGTLSIICMQFGFSLVGAGLNMKFPGHGWQFGWLFGFIVGSVPYLNTFLKRLDK